MVMTLIAVPLVANTSVAGANTKSNFSTVVNGVEVGWTNGLSSSGHAWGIVSYATAISEGAGEVASSLCNTVLPGSGSVCSYVIQKLVASLIAGKTKLTKGGVWVAYYPFKSLGSANPAYSTY
jgi:hypothetical protein